MTGRCELCELDKMVLTEHHLIPRARHNKKVKRDFGADRRTTIGMCQPCHDQLHNLFAEKELERQYNTLEKLKAHLDVQRWVEWKRKRPNLGQSLRA